MALHRNTFSAAATCCCQQLCVAYLQFPKTLEGPALQLLHHRVLSLDAAAQVIIDLHAAAEATGLPRQASVVLGAAPPTKLPKAAVVLWLSQVRL